MYIYAYVSICYIYIYIYIYVYIYIFIYRLFLLSELFQDVGKKPMISIHFKKKLLDEVGSLEVAGSREAVMLERYPNILRKGMLNKWKRNARRQRWHLLPVEISKQHKEIPNYLRESLGLQKRGKVTANNMPLEVLHKFDNALFSKCRILQAQHEANELLRSRSMITLMKSIVAKYNSNIGKNNIEITRKNNELLLAFKNGDISAEDALQGKKKHQKQVFNVYIHTYIYISETKNTCIYTLSLKLFCTYVHNTYICLYIYTYIYVNIYSIKNIYIYVYIHVYVHIIYIFHETENEFLFTNKCMLMHTF